MTDRSYAVEIKLLDVLKALMEAARNNQADFEWVKSEIKELEHELDAYMAKDSNGAAGGA